MDPRKYFWWVSHFFKSFGSRDFLGGAAFRKKCAQGKIGNLVLQATSLFNANPKDNIALAQGAHPLSAGNRGGGGGL